MKLDSIIYDTNTLSSALKQKLLEESPTFKAMYPSDTGTALVNLLSGYGSMLQYSLVSAMANCYTDTAFSVDGIYQLAETLGNRLQGNASAQINCLIKRNNCDGVSKVFIPANSVFDVDGVKFYNENIISFPTNVDTTIATLTQGEKKIVEKYTSGVAGEKIYFSENFKCDMNNVKVYIDGVQWHTLETFLPLNSNNLADVAEAQSVLLRMEPDGRAYIKIGNNTNGITPSANTPVKIEYTSNEGALGNIENINAKITLETPLYFHKTSKGEVLLDVTITPTSTASGGYNTQDLQTLKESSPFVFASGNRAVRREDYKAMLLNKCGYLSCNVWGEYEESQRYGYYSLAMMNTVYYTGIKSLHTYNNKPIGSLFVDGSKSDSPSNNKFIDNPIEFLGSIGPLRGFPGSYNIDIMYSLDNNVSINYSDKFGTGILTYDPSSNDKNQDEDLNGLEGLSPYNDLWEDKNSLPEDKFKIVSYQKMSDGFESKILYVPGFATEDKSSNEECVSFEGMTLDNYPIMLNFDSPLQIEINFGEDLNDGIAIAGFQFQAPKGTLDIVDDSGRLVEKIQRLPRFIGSFAIYATTRTDASKENIKNDADWDCVVDMQKIENMLEGEWTDWYTTNCFKYDRESGADETWKRYTRYMIEIYSQMDLTTNVSGGQIFIQNIRAVYNKYNRVSNQDGIITREKEAHHKVSTIDYANNNYVDLCIPSLLESMELYKYNVTAKGITYQNGYRTGDLLYYAYTGNGSSGVYYFNVKVANVESGALEIFLSKDLIGGKPEPKMAGHDQIKLDEVKLERYSGPGSMVSGMQTATISIESTPAIMIYGSTVGDAYSVKETEARDKSIIDKYNHFTTYIEFKQPRVKNTNIELTVEYENNNSYLQTKQNIIDAVHNVFELTPYYIGKTINVSEIWKAVNSVEGVKRFIVHTPTQDIHCEPFEFIMLPENNLIINDILTSTFK